jgi:hypothetical protein
LTAVPDRCIPRLVPPDLGPKVTLSWLVRLRWLAAAAQIVALLLARWVLELELGYAALVLVAVMTVVSNLVLERAPRLRARFTAHGVLGAILTLDVALLTVALAASGGPMNPFTVLYLVHITLSALALSAGWTTLVGAFSVVGFGLLFLVAPADPHAHTGRVERWDITSKACGSHSCSPRGSPPSSSGESCGPSPRSASRSPRYAKPARATPSSRR